MNCSKANAYGLEHIKNRTNQPGQMEWAQFFIKILAANFGNYILDNSNLDKISEGIIKEIHIWNRVRISLKGKTIIVNQTLLSKLWYMYILLLMYILLQNISKKKLKKTQFSLNRKQSATSQAPSSTLHLEGWTRYFRHGHLIKLSRNKID